MRKPRYTPRKKYRRSSGMGALRWRIRRGTKAASVAVALAVFALGAISGGDESGNFEPARNSPAAQLSAAQLIDQVTRVRDGDTIVVGLIPIRIANLDCAESGTAKGERATRRVRQLVKGQTVTCQLEGRRSYDREVGVCALPGGQDLGEVMIAEGLCKRWR